MFRVGGAVLPKNGSFPVDTLQEIAAMAINATTANIPICFQ
jgi:hypothetical protein